MTSHWWHDRPKAMQDPERPVPGYFRIRKVPRGPWFPARIARECHCTINGTDGNLPHAWRPSCDRYPHLYAEIDGAPEKDVMRVWQAGRLVTKPYHEYLAAAITWQRRHVNPYL